MEDRVLNTYQKILLIVMAVMMVGALVIYFRVTTRSGFLYMDTIYVPKEETGIVTYEGKLNGRVSKFIVTNGNKVEFQYGSTLYGPYIVKRDDTAIPGGREFAGSMIGYEILNGKEVVFRGGYSVHGQIPVLYSERDTYSVGFYNGAVYTGNFNVNSANIFGTVEPAPITIINLVNGPELTHKGDWSVWFWALLLSVVNAITIIFADELFRFFLAFRVYDSSKVEPSDWEIFTRYVSWTVVIIFIAVLLNVGLQR